MSQTFKNPIIPGFHPDPTICRVGNDYYLSTSTFEWSPGCPIFHSRDLVDWRLIGHALTTQEQLPLDGLGPSSGVFAPGLRHHNGRFYLITTIVDMAAQTFRNFIVATDDPAGEWSPPIVLPGVERIDPSLFFEDAAEGTRVWLTANRFPSQAAPEAGGNREIWLQELDAKTLQPISEAQGIWWGAQQNANTPEAPHIYKKDGWYWLLTAEGGTGFEHCVCVARAREITGPWQGCPRNPILTHRHLGTDYPITCTGHGDLVQTQNGEWWMVLLGCRPLKGLSLLGRETFLTPVYWPEGDWPVVNPGKGLVDQEGARPNLPACPVEKEPGFDDFHEATLPPHWCSLLNPRDEFWKTGPGGLELTPSTHPLEAKGTAGLLARRVRQHDFRAELRLTAPVCAGLETGITLYQNHANHLRLSLLQEPGRTLLRMVRVRRGEREAPQEQDLTGPPENLTLQIMGKGLKTAFSARSNGDKLLETEQMDSGFLAAALAGGFTGVMTGFFAVQTQGGKCPPVRVHSFQYQEEKQNE